MSAAPQGQPGAGRELEGVLLAVALLLLGPFALAAGLLLALLARSRRLVLCAIALPSTAGGLLLWPFAHRHYDTALVALHHAFAVGRIQAFLAVWPHIWPAWLAMTSLAPLVALVILFRHGRSRFTGRYRRARQQSAPPRRTPHRRQSCQPPRDTNRRCRVVSWLPPRR